MSDHTEGPGYVLVDIEVHDADAYDRYKAMAQAAVEGFGGRYLVRGGAAEVLEGEWPARRVVVLEFPTVARAREWWGSEDYAPAKALRNQSATTRMLLVEGVAR